MIWIINDFNRFYSSFLHLYRLFYQFRQIYYPFWTSEPSFRARKCPKMPKNQYFFSKIESLGPWIGLKPILIDSISDYYISSDYSMNSNKCSHHTGPRRPSFRARKCPKMPKNQYFLPKMESQGPSIVLKPIMIDSIDGYYIISDFSMNSNKCSHHTAPSGPSFRAKKCPNMAKHQYFHSKMESQGQWIGLKPILIDSISGYYISSDYSMNSNKFSHHTEPRGPSFRARKCARMTKNQYLPSKMATEGPWIGFKPILIDSIGGYYISSDYSMNSNKLSHHTKPRGPSFEARKCPKMPKNQYWTPALRTGSYRISAVSW